MTGADWAIPETPPDVPRIRPGARGTIVGGELDGLRVAFWKNLNGYPFVKSLQPKRFAGYSPAREFVWSLDRVTWDVSNPDPKIWKRYL